MIRPFLQQSPAPVAGDNRTVAKDPIAGLGLISPPAPLTGGRIRLNTLYRSRVPLGSACAGPFFLAAPPCLDSSHRGTRDKAQSDTVKFQGSLEIRRTDRDIEAGSGAVRLRPAPRSQPAAAFPGRKPDEAFRGNDRIDAQAGPGPQDRHRRCSRSAQGGREPPLRGGRLPLASSHGPLGLFGPRHLPARARRQWRRRLRETAHAGAAGPERCWATTPDLAHHAIRRPDGEDPHRLRQRRRHEPRRPRRGARHHRALRHARVPGAARRQGRRLAPHRPVRRRVLLGLHGGQARGRAHPQGRLRRGLALVLRRAGLLHDRAAARTTRRVRGTRVVLHLAEGSEDYAEGYTVERIVREHGSAVPVPVDLVVIAKPAKDGESPDGSRAPPHRGRRGDLDQAEERDHARRTTSPSTSR